MRYILNFNQQAAQLLGTKNTALNLTSGSTKRRGSYVLVSADTGSGPAFSPASPDSERYKTRISAEEAFELGLKGAKRYTLERRGNSERFYLEPAVTVSVTETL